MLTSHLQLVPRRRMRGVIPPLSLRTFKAWTKKTFSFAFLRATATSLWPLTNIRVSTVMFSLCPCDSNAPHAVSAPILKLHCTFRPSALQTTGTLLKIKYSQKLNLKASKPYVFLSTVYLLNVTVFSQNHTKHVNKRFRVLVIRL